MSAATPAITGATASTSLHRSPTASRASSCITLSPPTSARPRHGPARSSTSWPPCCGAISRRTSRVWPAAPQSIAFPWSLWCPPAIMSARLRIHCARSSARSSLRPVLVTRYCCGGPSGQCHSTPSAHLNEAGFWDVAATGALDGEPVLLIDDTWTTGASAQSAAATLKKAGSGPVAAVVIGRHLNRDWGENDRRLRSLPTPFDWNRCAHCETGGTVGSRTHVSTTTRPEPVASSTTRSMPPRHH
jgi:hypothetical protein